MMWVEILNKRWIPCSADNAKRCSMDQCHLSATLANGSNSITGDYSKMRFKLFCHFLASPRSPDRVWCINYFIFCLSRDGGFIVINSRNLIRNLTIGLMPNCVYRTFPGFFYTHIFIYSIELSLKSKQSSFTILLSFKHVLLQYLSDYIYRNIKLMNWTR